MAKNLADPADAGRSGLARQETWRVRGLLVTSGPTDSDRASAHGYRGARGRCDGLSSRR
jgi:hypothetical protein